MKEETKTKYVVYMHINKVNDKKYIGITKDVNRRWSYNGIEYREQIFGKAIQKYGWDNFEHIVLFENLNKEQACEKEIELIEKYDTTNAKYGYNVSLGGDGIHKPFSCIYQYSLDGKFIKKYKNIIYIIEEFSLKTPSNIYACCSGKRVSSCGFRWFYEYQGEKIDPVKTPIERTIAGESIPIYQYSLQGDFIKRYKSRQEVLELTGIDPQSCIRRITETAGNYQWFNNYQGKKINAVLSSSEKLGLRQSKKVYLYDINYNLIKTFDKCKDVCKYFNTYHKKIKNIIDNRLIINNCYISYDSYQK